MLLVAALATGGCGEDNYPVDLVRVETVAAGDAACPAGGLRIHQGQDANQNGVLDDAEITTTSDTCTQGDVLATSARFPAGDADCPAGGIEVSYGLDNGDGGGTAANGVLEQGEIDDTEKLCDDAALASPVGSDAPAGDPGTNVIVASGGNATINGAGNGGAISITGADDTGVHHINVFRTGSYEASVALPAFEVDLGDTPIEVTASRAIGNIPGDLTGVTGEFYDDATGTLVKVVSGMATTATGLHVAPGVTLTLPNQADETIQLKFTGDVHLEGTITLGAGAAPDMLSILPNELWASEGSSIDLVTGMDSSSLSISAMRVASAADIIASGPGLAGNVSITGTGEIINLGDIDTSGADSATPTDGGDVTIWSYSNIGNAGNITATGGSGAAAVGADGGGVLLYAGLILGGALTNTGTIDASGGTATAVASAGGDAGSVALTAVGGALISTGDLLARGRGGVAQGGTGGAITLTQAPGFVSPYLPGAIRIDASLDSSGGAGEAGANGGAITVVSSGYGVEAIAFYGVERIASDGGDASASPFLGGNAGSLTIDPGAPAASTLSTGAIVLRTDISLTGGSGGGSAGAVSLDNALAEDFGTVSPVVAGLILEGTLDLRGGDHDEGPGGPGGAFTASTRRDVEIVGDILTNGGSCLDDSTNGGVGGQVALSTSNGALNMTGDIDTGGGDGETGGNGAAITVSSSHSVVDGNLFTTGGAGVTNGGNGGSVQFFSIASPGSVTGTVDTSGGAGMTPGTDGFAFGSF